MRRLGLSALILAAVLSGSACTTAGRLACASTSVVVSGAAGGVGGTVCAGAEDAFSFLEPLGLQLPHQVQIDLAPAMPAGLGEDVAACTSTASRRITLLQYPAFMRHEVWMGVPPQRALYRSIVTHEVVHAIVRCHVGDRKLAVAASEYIAYVAMFATMDPALRDRVLAAHPGTGFDHVSQATLLAYAFDPTGFGAEAWRHWVRAPDRVALLHRVVAGQAITEYERD